LKPAAIVTLALTLAVYRSVVAQNVLPQEVDRIFAAYDHSNSPGCSVGVMRDGRFVYRKSYGLASLELGVPLSSQSAFYVGSISKQFTAASVVLAAEQGALSLDDDIRKYIPELPDYGHTITVRQMLYQTSGLRDFFDLLYFSGLDAAEFNSPDEILKLVVRQRGLNNIPGGEWVYSNTNYFLLGIALQRATKRSLAEFAAGTIFRPLGMTHTLFYHDASVVVPERVAAYALGANGNFLIDWSTSYSIVGGGGMITTVDDLLLWDKNFNADRLGKGTLIEELEKPGVLNDGSKTAYAMGLYLANHRGLATVEHDGALFGYRADYVRFPEQKLSVACLCNLASADPLEFARKVADLYLKSDLKPEVGVAALVEDEPLPASAVFAAKYLDPSTHLTNSFVASDGNLKQNGQVLWRTGANEFYDLPGNVISFEAGDGKMQARISMHGETFFTGTKVEQPTPSAETLAGFAGLYRSTELDGAFAVSAEQGNLVLRIGSNPPIKLVAIADDEFDAGGFMSIVFHREVKDGVTGLIVFARAARGIEFNKTKSEE
jgi:CubicO group peptidase (beta-lactamase class C family)